MAFIDDDKEKDTRVSASTALRHVLVFQLKLAADAFRDFILSPLSLIAFAVDALRQPKLEDSFYLRLMLLGRRSDRVINLFDEHRDGEDFTIDHAVDELEEVVRRAQGEKAYAPSDEAMGEHSDGAQRESEVSSPPPGKASES